MSSSPNSSSGGSQPLSPIAELLRPEPAQSHEHARDWWAAHRAVEARTPFEAAVRGGARADRVAWAFAAGYEAALWRLLPGRDRRRAGALCATEVSGVHPRAMQTRFADGALEGHKTFVTLGAEAEDLYVLAVEGERDGRPALALVRAAQGAPGVTLEPLPSAPFVPEIPHAAVRFEGATGERLPGDGWADYVRPFRTVEDVHVHAALLAYLASTGVRAGWPSAPIEAALAALTALSALSEADPSARVTHLSLAGVIAQTRDVVEALEPCWQSASAESAGRWARDRRLLEIAGKARAARRERAWARDA